EEARVHFIPYLKEGVFVTLCAPVVRKLLPSDKCLLVQRVKVGFLKRKSKKNLFHLKGEYCYL
ncbi:hypothetical protein, partial [Methanosarcina mazei]